MQRDMIKPNTFIIDTAMRASALFSMFRKAVKAIIVVLVIKLLLVFIIIMSFYYVAAALINFTILSFINIMSILISLSSITVVLLSSRPLLKLYTKKLRLFSRLQRILSSITVLLTLFISILAIVISVIAISFYPLELTSPHTLGISIVNVSTNASSLTAVRSILESLLSIPSLSVSLLGLLLALSWMFISDLLYLYAIGLVAVVGALLGMGRAMILICIYMGTFIGLWCVPITLLPISIVIVCAWIVVSVLLAITFDELSINVLKVYSSNAKDFA